MIEVTPGKGLDHIGGVESRADVVAAMARENYGRVVTGQNSRRRVMEAARLLDDCVSGREDPLVFKEALMPTRELFVQYLREKYPRLWPESASRIGLRETMAVTDFSALFTDVLDRALYGYYTDAPITNMPMVKRVTLRDFRVVARYAVDYGTKPWSEVYDDTALPPTPTAAGEPPTQRSLRQAAREVLGPTQRVTYQPQAYTGGMSVDWRAIINDDLGVFQQMTQHLAIGGRRTLYSYITSLYMSSTGPNTTLYSATFKNLVTTTYGASKNNPALDFQGLSDALIVLEKMLDIEGQPITFDGQLYLWYGPALETTAAALLNSVGQADLSVLGGTQNTQGFPTARLRVDTQYITRNMKPIQDKYIPIINTSSSSATCWGLIYDPSAQARPAIELGFLVSYDTPQLFQKAPNTMRVGGGMDPMVGDFYTMQQEYKGLLVFGGTQIDGRSTVASTGLNV